MPRSKEQLAVIRAATNEKIQSAAIRLFARQGYAGTSVQQIADEAGISPGLMYSHYRNKEALYTTLMDDVINALNGLRLVMEGEGTPKEILCGVIQEVYDDVMTNEDYNNMMVLMTQVVFSDSTVLRAAGEADTALLESTARLIERGQGMGQFLPGDSLQMATLLFSAIQGLSEMRIVLGDKFDMPVPQLINRILCKED